MESANELLDLIPSETALTTEHCRRGLNRFLSEVNIESPHGPVPFAECIAPFQSRDFVPLGNAFEAVAKGKQPEPGRIWIERTKGASKDSDVALCLLWALAFSERALDCPVGAADRDQADEVRKAAKSIMRANPWLGELLEIQNYNIVSKRTESKARIIAADVAGAHGARPDISIINELSHITKEEFAQNLLDNAAKVPSGLTVILTNAGFLDTWQWRLREAVRESDRWYFSAQTEPAPWLDPAEIEERRRSVPPMRFARLWKGEWVSQSGEALAPEDIRAAIKLDGPQDREPGWVYVAGLDIGLAKDATALVVVGKRQLKYRVAWVQYWLPKANHRVSLEEVEKAILGIHARYSLSKLAFDPTQAEYLTERLSKRMLTERVTFGATNTTEMATLLMDGFTSGSLELYDHAQLMHDLYRLKLIEKPGGLKLDSPRGPLGHGDCATALAIAMLAARTAIQRGSPAVGTTVERMVASAPRAGAPRF